MPTSLADTPADATPSAATPLSDVSETLRIPLAARALGDRLFPGLAVHDAHAARVLARLGDDGSQWLRDRQSVYGSLARTWCFRRLATAFLERHPEARVLNLGCGLSDYFQWLDNGRMQMTDADLPAVLALRRELLPPPSERLRMQELDLALDDWWQRLGLAEDRSGPPVFMMVEGVCMYLQPEQVQALWMRFAQSAPAGSELAFDAMCWLAAGRAGQHPSVRHTKAQFHWGLRRPADMQATHPRLRLLASHRVMEGYGLPYSIMGPVFQMMFGVPFYAVYQLGVEGD
jgi:O-methyltransferase involved in polyketide biosynthesis